MEETEDMVETSGLVVDTNMRTLMDFKYKRKYTAENGGNGKGSNMHGKTERILGSKFLQEQ